MSDLLAAIVAGTRRTVEVRQAREPIAELARRADAAASNRTGSGGRFRAALTRGDRINVIAECKRRSPANGVLRSQYDPVAIARAYVSAGAAALSILTESSFFDGSLDHLEAVRRAVDAPLLRKDFIVSPYQILEARAAGADAILLIVAALSQAELQALSAEAVSQGLETLVEVHDRDELARAADAGAEIIGVNNRNLRTLEVDLRVSEDLVARLPVGAVAVSESGLKTADDLLRLRALGFGAFLIGERFMMSANPGEALSALIGGAAGAGRTEGAKRAG